jgi:hypothetical protein
MTRSISPISAMDSELIYLLKEGFETADMKPYVRMLLFIATNLSIERFSHVHSIIQNGPEI